MMRDNRVFIVGCGYVGERVAAEARHRGREVFALARTPRSAQHLLTFGIEPVRGDLDDRGTLQDMPTDDATIYYFAPPPDKGDRDPRIGAFLDAIRIGQLPRRIVLISTVAAKNSTNEYATAPTLCIYQDAAKMAKVSSQRLKP